MLTNLLTKNSSFKYKYVECLGFEYRLYIYNAMFPNKYVYHV